MKKQKKKEKKKNVVGRLGEGVVAGGRGVLGLYRREGIFISSKYVFEFNLSALVDSL